MVLVILLMFALFGAMFFMTLYLENVHGLRPTAVGVHLLPVTAMLIVGSPLADTVISRIGLRRPIVAGMTMAAAAMSGLSRLGATASPNDTVIWFVLLCRGLAPVMAGATYVIVGNAPAQLAGVACPAFSCALAPEHNRVCPQTVHHFILPRRAGCPRSSDRDRRWIPP